MKKISFVIPCYRSAQTIEQVVKEIDATMAELLDYTHEIVLVNDCSPDDTFSVITAICNRSDNVIGIDLAKNFGQHAALMAGLRETTGDYVICLDDDGQTPACEAGKLIDALEAGNDAVYARYEHKKHSAFRNFGTYMNEKMAEHMLGKPRDLYVSSYFGVRRFIVDDMMKYENAYPYVIGLVLRATRRIVNVDVNHREREVGRSGYTLSKLMALWINGFTAFSIKPLRISAAFGAVMAFAGLIYGIYTIIRHFVVGAAPMGYASMMSALVFIGGMLMLMLGLLGEYIGRTYISLNNSPQYVIRTKVKHNDHDKEE